MEIEVKFREFLGVKRGQQKGNDKYHITKDGRCVANKSFGDVRKGDVGGYVENYTNLSAKDTCWVYDDARVASHSDIQNSAKIMGHATIQGGSTVRGNAVVMDRAAVIDSCEISGDVVVKDKAVVKKNTFLSGQVVVKDSAEVVGSVLSGSEVVGARKKVIDVNEDS